MDHQGSCLCGKVKWQTSGPIIRLNLCHCDMCQKAHGAAFAPYARVRKADFRFVAGKECVRLYKSSQEVTRTFCDECGSTLQWYRDDAEGLGIAAGTFDTAFTEHPSAQFFCVDSQPWHMLRDDVPKFETVPEP